MQSKHYYLLMLLCLVAIAPYFIVSFYCHPIADDYHYAWAGKTFPLADRLLFEYNNWNGRYFSNIFVLNNPLTFDSLAGYQFIPILLIIMLIGSFAFFIYSVSNRQLNFKTVLMCSLIFTLVYLSGCPLLSENVYWYTGAVTYLFSGIAAMLHFSLLAALYYQNIVLHKSLHLFLLSLSLIIVIGCNEVAMLFMLVFYLVVFIKTIRLPIAAKKQYMLLFLLAVVCSGLVVVAPGNDYRSSHFNANHNFCHSVGFTLLQVFRFDWQWVATLTVPGIALLSFLDLKEIKNKIDLFRNEFFLAKWQQIIFLLLLPAIFIFPAYWSTGILGQQRSVNLAFLFFAISWFIFLTCYSDKIGFIAFKGNKLFIQMLMLTLFVSVSAKNGYTVFYDLFYGKAAAYHNEMLIREQQLQHAANTGKNEATLSVLSNKPASLFVLDIVPGSGHWINDNYAKYYGIKKVNAVKSD